MKPNEILQEFRRLVDLPQIEVTPLLPESGFQSSYAPIVKYLNELQKGTKPETAAEGLFRALADVFFNAPTVPQVGLGSGFVDFKLDAKEESSIVIELKPLFAIHSGDALKRDTLKPASYTDQIQRYLQHSEYLVLTDLRDAYLYSARDVWQNLKPFAKLPFADLLERALETRSLLDVIRNAEDGEVRPDLDRSFFEQLQEWFRAFEPVRFTDKAKHDELIIQLLNQLIFAKTMEDYSLVRYRHLQDEFVRAKERWQAKGPFRIVEQFLTDFERFFEDYYDTELFERSIWKELDREPKNLERFARLLEAVLGVDEWSKTFQRGIVHYNYRLINEDIFGKSYEMFLASNRKDEGIFYTPATITVPMADSLVDGLFSPLVTQICAAVSAGKADFAAADALMPQLARLAIADTAGGSGGFLIKVLRAVWRQYQQIEKATAWVKNWQNGGDLMDTPPNVQQARAFRERWNFDNRRVLVAQILLRHIFAVDKDAGAIEVAKTNLWKEAVKLSSDDYNFRQLTGDINRTLPSLRLNFICADSLVDTDPAAQSAYLVEVCGDAMKKLCALREQYIVNPSDHAPLEEALKLQAKLRENLTEHFQGEVLPGPAIFMALSFFPAWFEQDGKARPANASGLDGIIGNPPWEAVKPVRREFALKEGKIQSLAKAGMDSVQYEKWFEEQLSKDAEFAAKWKNYQDSYGSYKEYLGRKFHHQGGSDWNLFKLFFERDLSLVRQGGCLSLLIPSGIQTDEGCSDLRRLIITEHRLDELTSFENRGFSTIQKGKPTPTWIFPDVDNRFKFGIVKVRKGVLTPDNHAFDARFYLRDPADVFQPPIRYSIAMMRRFSPQTLSLMEFRSAEDYAVCGKIRGERPLLSELGFHFRRELHPADDVRLFHKRTGEKLRAGQLPIYEGKMIHQFEDGYCPGQFYAESKPVHAELKRKEIFRLAAFVRDADLETLEGKPLPKKKEDLTEFLEEIFDKKKFKLDYQFERLVFRRVGSSTNERTVIATVLSEDIVFSDSLSYLMPCRYEVSDKGKLLQVELPAEEVRSLLTLLNSLVVNYYIRNRVSATVNMFYVYELPLPKLATAQKKKLAEAAAKLLKNPRDVKERAALEVFIARDLYGLSLDDWKHLTGSFTFGGDSDTKAELDEIIRQSLALWSQ